MNLHLYYCELLVEGKKTFWLPIKICMFSMKNNFFEGFTHNVSWRHNLSQKWRSCFNFWVIFYCVWQIALSVFWKEFSTFLYSRFSMPFFRSSFWYRIIEKVGAQNVQRSQVPILNSTLCVYAIFQSAISYLSISI